MTPSAQIDVLFREWFGSSAGVSVCRIDGTCPLFPQEEALLRAAVPKRRAEFSTGRWCARQALAELGLPAAPILTGTRHEPLWPSGIAGSITHTATISAAVVCHIGSWEAIGIDLLEAVDAARSLENAGHIIASQKEASHTREATKVDPLPLIFSAKESAIKAVSARLERFVDFTEIAVRFEETSFEATLPGICVHGWWRSRDDLIVTAATLAKAKPGAV